MDFRWGWTLPATEHGVISRRSLGGSHLKWNWRKRQSDWQGQVMGAQVSCWGVHLGFQIKGSHSPMLACTALCRHWVSSVLSTYNVQISKHKGWGSPCILCLLEINRHNCNSEEMDWKLPGSLNTFSKLGICFHVVVARVLAFYYIISFQKDWLSLYSPWKP